MKPALFSLLAFATVTTCSMAQNARPHQWPLQRPTPVTRPSATPRDDGPHASENILFVGDGGTGGGFNAPVIQAWDGLVYGVNPYGGSNGQGSIFGIMPSSGEVAFVNMPTGGAYEGQSTNLLQGPDGEFYFNASGGGTNLEGAIYKLTSAGVFTDLYDFTGGQDGSGLTPAFILASDGNFYGSDYSGGGTGNGTLFKVSPSGKLTILTNNCPEGGECLLTGASAIGLVQAADGSFWGVNAIGGPYNNGTLFHYDPVANAISVAYAFTGGTLDGGSPGGNIVFGPDGNLYFLLTSGGANTTGGLGMYNLSTQTETLVDSFDPSSFQNGNTGFISIGPNGNLYYPDATGGTYSNGSFHLYNTVTQQAFDIYDSLAQDDFYAPASLSPAADGTFIGNSQGGLVEGDDVGYGTIFQMTMTPAIMAGPVQVEPVSGYLGGSITINAFVNNAFSLNMQQCYAYGVDPQTFAMAPLGKLTGSLSDGVWSGSLTMAPGYAGNFFISVTCGGVESGGAFATISKVAMTSSVLGDTVSGNVVTVNIGVRDANNAAVDEGSVSLSCNGVSLGSAPVNASQASFYPSLAGRVGTYSCKAAFSDPAYYGTGSTSFSVTVTPQSTSTSLTAPQTVAHDASGQITATVVGAFASPTGSVTFYGNTVNSAAGARVLSTQALTTGSTPYSTAVAEIPADVPPGPYYVFARYNGNASTTASTSSFHAVTVTASNLRRR